MANLVVEDIFEVRANGRAVELEGSVKLPILRHRRMVLQLGDESLFCGLTDSQHYLCEKGSRG